MFTRDEGSRPRVTGFFAEPGGEGLSLTVAIGRAVMGAAALEAAMRLETARLLHAEHAAGEVSVPSLSKELSQLDRETGGDLLQRLRRQGLPSELCKRILSAIERRNQIVHRPFEDPELARLIGGTGDVEGVVGRIERLAIDCGELAVELEMFAIPKVLRLTDMSRTQLVDFIKAADPGEQGNARDRKQLEAIQALLESEDLSGVFQELGISEPSAE